MAVDGGLSTEFGNQQVGAEVVDLGQVGNLFPDFCLFAPDVLATLADA